MTMDRIAEAQTARKTGCVNTGTALRRWAADAANDAAWKEAV